MINTPGYYYAAAYWLSAVSVIAAADGRPRSILTATLTDLASCAVLLGFMQLTSEVRGAVFLLSMTAIILFLYSYIRLRTRIERKRCWCMCLRSFICGEFLASTSWLIHFRLFERALLPCVLSAIGMAACAAALLFRMERRLPGRDAEIHVSRRMMLIYAITALLVYCISNMSYLDGASLFGAKDANDIFLIRTLADACGLALLYVYEMQYRDMERRFEMDMLRETIELQYQSYRLSKESMDMVNRKYHDLKHQIALLRSETPEEKQRHLDILENEIRGYESRYKTGNAVLDVVLASKHAVCLKDGIELRTIADGGRLTFMNEMDVSVLFGNMLDNAIECVQRIPEREKRLVRIFVGAERSFLLIRMSNYCLDRPDFVDGLPRTIKKDESLHGYGMKSIRSTVEKYGGTMTAVLEDSWFEVRILFPGRGRQETGDPSLPKERKISK